MFSQELNKKLDQYHLLNHPFYKSWNEEINKRDNKGLRRTILPTRKSISRYISATHSICEDIEKKKFFRKFTRRRKSNADHPKLWKNFAIAMGADTDKIEDVKREWFTNDMIENFFHQARKSYAEGLASLYTYERQIPEIAETKIRGLKILWSDIKRRFRVF